MVVAVSFIDRIGGTLLFPFFSLYITQKFNVGMTEAGYVLGLFRFSGWSGSLLVVHLTDKFGRRNLILFGLVFSAPQHIVSGPGEYICRIDTSGDGHWFVIRCGRACPPGHDRRYPA